MDLLERVWITPGEFGGTKLLESEADADAWRKAGYPVTGPWVLESPTPRGAVTTASEVAVELRALGDEWRMEWPDGRVCKAELNRLADRLGGQ